MEKSAVIFNTQERKQMEEIIDLEDDPIEVINLEDDTKDDYGDIDQIKTALHCHLKHQSNFFEDAQKLGLDPIDFEMSDYLAMSVQSQDVSIFFIKQGGEYWTIRYDMEFAYPKMGDFLEMGMKWKSIWAIKSHDPKNVNFVKLTQRYAIIPMVSFAAGKAGKYSMYASLIINDGSLKEERGDYFDLYHFNDKMHLVYYVLKHCAEIKKQNVAKHFCTK